MPVPYKGTPTELIQTAKNAMVNQGELEGYLRSWMSLRDDFAAFVKDSHTAASIQTTMDSAHTSGKKLAQTLQDILELLRDTGVKIDATDLENKARVDRSSVTGLSGVQTGTNSSVDTASWA